MPISKENYHFFYHHYLESILFMKGRVQLLGIWEWSYCGYWWLVRRIHELKLKNEKTIYSVKALMKEQEYTQAPKQMIRLQPLESWFNEAGGWIYKLCILGICLCMNSFFHSFVYICSTSIYQCLHLVHT